MEYPTWEKEENSMTTAQKHYFHFMGFGQLVVGDVFKFVEGTVGTLTRSFYTICEKTDGVVKVRDTYRLHSSCVELDNAILQNKEVMVFPYRSNTNDCLRRENIVAKRA